MTQRIPIRLILRCLCVSSPSTMCEGEKTTTMPEVKEETTHTPVQGKEGESVKEDGMGGHKQEDTQSTCSDSSSSSSSSSPSQSSTSSTDGCVSGGGGGGVSVSSAPDTSRAINIEDSDKKYVVIEPSKPKTWLAAYKLVPQSSLYSKLCLASLPSLAYVKGCVCLSCP